MNLFDDIVDLGDKLNHLIMPKYLKGNAIIDAGSNIGNFISKIRSLGIESNVLALEPCRSNIKILNDKNMKNVTVLSMAMVGNNSVDKISFTEIEGLSEWGSVTDINTDRGLSKGKPTYRYLVETITLDKLISKYGYIDYLKMDIEGCETDVIQSMTLLSAKNVGQISMEIHNKDEKELELKLKNLGYNTLFKKDELFAIRGDICE